MSKYKKLNDKVYVSGQLQLEDIKEVAALGVGLLVCNRPDGEGDQTNAAQLAAEAGKLGIKLAYLPMASVPDAKQHVAAFKACLVDAGDKPVLAYCRTGRRSAALWAEAMRDQSDVRDLIKTVKQVDIDISEFFKTQ